MENHLQKQKWFGRAKPLIAVVSMQFAYASSDILSMTGLNKGMSIYVFVIYRNAVAFIVMAPFALYFDRKVRPVMTLSIFIKIAAISVLSSVIGQNLYYVGMKFTTATFASAMANMLPTITFILAFILRLETIKIRSIRSQAKVVGTLASVSGAMVMTLVKGPVIFGKHSDREISHNKQHNDGTNTLLRTVAGTVMIIIACVSWACSVNLQAITLKVYPAPLSLTAWICFLATVGCVPMALIMERDNPSVWAIDWDMKLLCAVYTGIVVSGLCYYLQGIVVKTRGPVFVTAFTPLGMVMVAIMAYFLMAEQMFLGRVIGAIVICIGLYLVVWGKSIDYSPSPPESINPEEVLPAKKIVEKDNATKNNEQYCTHEVIIIQ